MSRGTKQEIERAWLAGDHPALVSIAGREGHRVVRFLVSRLYSQSNETKRKAVEALGAVAADATILDGQRAVELLRRFVWALNDESGTVPYGVPEAIGEMLAVRPEFQREFLPILCSLLTEDDMSQTGRIERGAIWAVGRVGRPAGDYSEALVAAVQAAAESHPDPETREEARLSLNKIARNKAE